MSIRFCSFEGASDNIWHVLVRLCSIELVALYDFFNVNPIPQDVTQNSPASKAGLIADEDYIVATDAILNDRDDLSVT